MMASSSSTSKTKDAIPPTATTVLSAKSRNHDDVPPLALTASDIAFSNRLHSMNLPGPSIPDPSVAQNVTFEENDIIIAVMGPTGAGKSSFVNIAAGKGGTGATVGRSDFKTRTVNPVRSIHPDGRRNIVLMDTPGFNDTFLTDTQILKMIANWLKETYQKNIKLAGLLYLHRVSDVRMSGTPLRNLAVFKDLCGDGDMKNIILVTTMWDLEDPSIGAKREEELRSKYWKDMIYLGSRTGRFLGTYASAWGIIDSLNLESARQTREPLRIQREMVDRHMQFKETTAAGTLFRFLAVDFKKVWARVRSGTRKTRSGIRIPSKGYRPSTITSANESSSSGISLSMTSMVASGNSSYHTHSSSPTGSIPLGCSAYGHRETLLAMIQGLMLAHQIADLASVPTLRGAIGTVLQTAQMIEGMSGVHHAIVEVVEYSGCLLEGIAQCTESGISKDMRKTLSSFQKELKNLQSVTEKISTRGALSRFLLHDADIKAISACTATIRNIYDRFEVRIAMDNLEAIARLEDQLTKLGETREALRQCECGRFVVREESGQPSTSRSL